MSLEVKRYSGKSLSRFRTRHTADFYADITSANDAIQAFDFAKNKSLKPFVLGAGSNVFFKNSKIKSFVMKNALPKKLFQHIKGKMLLEYGKKTINANIKK